MNSDCDDHVCPKCKKPYGHKLPAGYTCSDLRKRLRVCETCIAPYAQLLLWDSPLIPLDYIP